MTMKQAKLIAANSWAVRSVFGGYIVSVYWTDGTGSSFTNPAKLIAAIVEHEYAAMASSSVNPETSACSATA